MLYILIINRKTLVKMLFINGQPKFQPPGNIDLPRSPYSLHGILGGWVPDQLPSRRLFELEAATQCTF
jgi:hypothetical protein